MRRASPVSQHLHTALVPFLVGNTVSDCAYRLVGDCWCRRADLHNLRRAWPLGTIGFAARSRSIKNPNENRPLPLSVEAEKCPKADFATPSPVLWRASTARRRLPSTWVILELLALAGLSNWPQIHVEKNPSIEFYV